MVFSFPWINGAEEELLNLQKPLAYNLEQITQRRIDYT